MQLNEIKYVDHPELRLDEHESTEMPFRYIANDDGSPMMPPVRLNGCLTSERPVRKFVRTMIDNKTGYVRADKEGLRKRYWGSLLERPKLGCILQVPADRRCVG